MAVFPLKIHYLVKLGPCPDIFYLNVKKFEKCDLLFVCPEKRFPGRLQISEEFISVSLKPFTSFFLYPQ
jgi:hypothetical protein